MSGGKTAARRAVFLAAIVTVSMVAIGAGPIGSVVANGHQSGADIVVQEGESIQQAVNDASPGDVIAVEPGTYNETVRVNTSDLTIKAADPSDPPTVRYAPDEPRSNATFEVIANGTVLSNLTIERVGHSNRTLDNVTAAVAIVPVDYERPDCTFSFSGCEDVTRDVLVKNNEIVGDFPLNDSNGGVGITDGIDYIYITEVAGDASNITIRGNEVHGFSGGVGLVAEYGGTITDVEIADNHVHDNRAEYNGSAVGTGVGFARNTTEGYFEDISVTGNNITANDYGVRLAGNESDQELEDVDASVIEVHWNDIAGNSEWGAVNNGTNTLNATHNWWGDQTGPSGEGDGDGDAVSTGVTFDPWLESSTT
jgi:hypothetical protein